MREILFRGRRKDYVPKPDDPEWMYWVDGDLVFNGLNTGKTYIKPIGTAFRMSSAESRIASAVILYEVDPETIGQYTGLKDCDGRRIFEGDILEYSAGTTQEFQPKDDERTVVRFGAYNCTCCKGVYGWFLAGGLGDIRDFEGCEECGPYRVIGNVHDNPELMEAAGKRQQRQRACRESIGGTRPGAWESERRSDVCYTAGEGLQNRAEVKMGGQRTQKQESERPDSRPIPDTDNGSRNVWRNGEFPTAPEVEGCRDDSGRRTPANVSGQWRTTEYAQKSKRILDPCCGSRMFWFEKNNPEVVFCDNRKLHETLCDGRSLDVKPDVIADFTDLPFPDNSFWHVVFDPPHILDIGENSWMAKKYGKLPSNWEDTIRKGFSECMRVLKPSGTLVFKWNEQDITVSKIISVIGHTPLYGHKSGKLQKTHWLAFIKDER